MTSVAVTAAAGALGRAVTAALAADPHVVRLLGVDVDEPAMPPGRLAFHRGRPGDAATRAACDGVDVLVHLGAVPTRAASAAGSDADVVRGTREALALAQACGAGAFVFVSTALVYGAHADNPVPLTEGDPVRADPAVPEAYHAALAEEAVMAFAAANPAVTVALLRPTSILGEDADTHLSRLLEAWRPPSVAGYAPPLQAVAVEDVASAVHRVVADRLEGVFNVAPDGWLTARDVAVLTGRRPLRLPEATAWGALSALRGRAGQVQAAGVLTSPGDLDVLMHPWVIDAGRLRAHGWSAQRSNREVLRSAARRHRPWVRIGALRLRRRVLYAGFVGMTFVLAGFVLRAFGRRC